jgi:hypothetical protein
MPIVVTKLNESLKMSHELPLELLKEFGENAVGYTCESAITLNEHLQKESGGRWHAYSVDKKLYVYREPGDNIPYDFRCYAALKMAGESQTANSIGIKLNNSILISHIWDPEKQEYVEDPSKVTAIGLGGSTAVLSDILRQPIEILLPLVGVNPQLDEYIAYILAKGRDPI